MLYLEVPDNGIGKSDIIHDAGFSRQLISLLTQQLSGSIQEEVKNGIHISFDFKLDKVAQDGAKQFTFRFQQTS